MKFKREPHAEPEEVVTALDTNGDLLRPASLRRAGLPVSMTWETGATRRGLSDANGPKSGARLARAILTGATRRTDDHK